jgi:pilus assembly protein CpaB
LSLKEGSMYNSQPTGTHRVTHPKKKSSALLFTIASLMVAGLVGFLVFQTINGIQPPPPLPVVRVLVAAHDLPLGKALFAEDVALIDWPQRDAIYRSFPAPEDVVGRVLTRPLVKGEAISDQRLAPREAGQGLGALIPKGMRAQALRVNDESGVAGFLRPGDFVDVVTILREEEGLLSKTSLQNVQVIAVGEQYQQRLGRGEGVSKALVVTVLVHPAQVALLALATTNGQVVLTLRNGYDTEKIATVGFSGETATIMSEVEEPPTVITKIPEPRPTKPGETISIKPEEEPTVTVDAPKLPQLIIGGKIVTSGDKKKKNIKVILVPML